jgi:hypothetical protein
MNAWHVYEPCSRDCSDAVQIGDNWYRWVDCVYYDDDCDEDYVRQGLINHDGYPSNIEVVKR